MSTVDDAPTPRQSGSYGVMADICATSIARLRTLLAKPCDAHQTRAYTLAMNRFMALYAHIETWAAVPPADEAKRETIRTIIELRLDTEKLAERFGEKLG